MTTPMQRVTFVCSGGEDEYCTTFAVFGLRYSLIETDVDYKPEDFRAIAVYSDMEARGGFSCSNEGQLPRRADRLPDKGTAGPTRFTCRPTVIIKCTVTKIYWRKLTRP